MNVRGFVLLAAAVVVVPSLAHASLSTQPSDALRARVFDGSGLNAGLQPVSSDRSLSAAAMQFQDRHSPFRLDDGGGVGSDTRKILSLILGFFPGFGIGHLVAHDQNGFVLFLVIDVAIAVTYFTLGALVHGIVWPLGGLLWVIERVVEALDAYASAGGERLLQIAREKTVTFGQSALPSPVSVPATTRLLRLQF